MIRYVTKEQLVKVIDGEDTRRDNFVAKEKEVYVACDNTEGEAFTEDFQTLWGAIRWLTLPVFKSKKRSELLGNILNEEETFEIGKSIDL